MNYGISVLFRAIPLIMDWETTLTAWWQVLLYSH